MNDLSIDQIVASNVRRWRKAAGLTQEELGQRTGWTAANISAAERSAEAGRDKRRFDAATLITFATALGVPLIALFLPPEGSDGPAMTELFARVMPESPDETPAMDAYRTALAASARRYTDPQRADDLAAYLDAMNDPEKRQERVRQRVDDLHAFEREYRKRLRGWLTEMEAVIGQDDGQ